MSSTIRGGVDVQTADPDIRIKRVIVALWAGVVLIASGIGFVACLVGLVDTGHGALVVGLIGCGLGLAAGMYLMWLAINTRNPL